MNNKQDYPGADSCGVQAQGQTLGGQCYSPEYVLNELLRYHTPRPDQLPKYQAIRAAAKYFAEVLLQNTPSCSDRTAAIRKIREAVMTANAAIALDGLSL